MFCAAIRTAHLGHEMARRIVLCFFYIPLVYDFFIFLRTTCAIYWFVIPFYCPAVIGSYPREKVGHSVSFLSYIIEPCIVHDRGSVSMFGEPFRIPQFFDRCSMTCAEDRKSTRLNSSHVAISYAVFCLKKKK